MRNASRVFFASAFMLAPQIALATSMIGAPALLVHNGNALVDVQVLLNSGNVGIVYYPGGRFERTGDRTWTEFGDNGAQFSFEETGFDESTVYLIDRSRNVQIGLDVSSRQILYAEGNSQFRLLYTITDMQMAGGQISPQPATSEIVSYSCNEGIPLIVRYENTPDESLAFVSHDSFPEIRMEIAPSGSGARYVNGGYELLTKGDTAIFIVDGTEDFCTED